MNKRKRNTNKFYCNKNNNSLKKIKLKKENTKCNQQ